MTGTSVYNKKKKKKMHYIQSWCSTSLRHTDMESFTYLNIGIYLIKDKIEGNNNRHGFTVIRILYKILYKSKLLNKGG